MTKVNWLHLIIAGGALLSAFMLGKRSAAPSRSSPKHKKAFVLAITIEFESEDDRDAWLKLWGEYASYVAANEPRTLGFEAMIADTNPKKIMVFERFASKADFTAVHQATAAFKEYKVTRSKLPYKTTINGQSYYETNLGYMQ